MAEKKILAAIKKEQTILRKGKKILKVGNPKNAADTEKI